MITLPRIHGACSQEVDDDLWFPVGADHTKMALRVAERDYCGTRDGQGPQCPVKGTCLKYALEHDEAGIWAATDETMRSQLRKQQGVRARTRSNTTASRRTA